MLYSLKLNFLLLNMVLVKLFNYQMLNKLLLSWMSYLLLNTSLIYYLSFPIAFYCSVRRAQNILTRTLIIQSHFETVLVVTNSLFTWQSKRLNNLKPGPLFSCKFSKKKECASILKKQQITFQALDYKRKNFLDLNNNNNLCIKLTYSEDNTWLKHIEHSKIQCACATRAIINHTLTSKYRLKFFPKESFTCSYRGYPIESRNHILNSYR